MTACQCLEHWIRHGQGATAHAVCFRFAPSTQGVTPDADVHAAVNQALALPSDDAMPVVGDERSPPVLGTFARNCLALLRRAGHRADGAEVTPEHPQQAWRVTIECEEPETALRAGALIAAMLGIGERSDSMSGPTLANDQLDTFLAFARARLLDPNAALFLEAARRRHLPWLDLDTPPFRTEREGYPISHGLVQIGHGHRRRVVIGSLPGDHPAQTLDTIASRTALLARLTAAGIPVPRRDPDSSNINRASRAVRAAMRLGGGVMLAAVQRPIQEWPAHLPLRYGPLSGETQVRLAYDAVAPTSRSVTVEAVPPGREYRFLVVGNAVRTVARRSPAAVMGNGRDSVAALLQEFLTLASEPHSRAARRALVDSGEALRTRLALQGLDLESVPAPGRVVTLLPGATAHQGGRYEECTAAIGSRHIALALRAARACELPGFCAVDMIIEPGSGEGVVVDLTPGPDLKGHLQPDQGAPFDAAQALLEHWFPQPEQARIPTIAVTGTNGKTTTCSMLAHVLAHAGRRVGLVTTEGARVDGDWLLTHDLAGAHGASMVFADPRTEVAILETARGGILKLGLPCEHFEIGACMNVRHDHIGEDGVLDLDAMAAVKGSVVVAAERAVVLGADDPRCLAMQAQARAPATWLVSRNPDHPALAEHAAKGGQAITLARHDGRAHLARLGPAGLEPLIAVDEIPAAWGGRAAFNVTNALFAAALALAHGLPASVVRDALSTFTTDWRHVAGRLNPYRGLPFEVLLDAAHNPQKYAALTDFVRQLPCAGRKRLVLFTRLGYAQTDTHAIAAAVAAGFDAFYCRDPKPDGRRELAPGESARQLRDALLAEGVDPERVRAFGDRQDAERQAVADSTPDDLLVICAMKHTDTRARLDALAETYPPRGGI